MPISTCLLTYQPPPVCLHMNLCADSKTLSALGRALRSGSMAPERILRRCQSSSISLNPSAVWTVRTYFFQSPSCVAKLLLQRGHCGIEHASFHFWMQTSWYLCPQGSVRNASLIVSKQIGHTSLHSVLNFRVFRPKTLKILLMEGIKSIAATNHAQPRCERRHVRIRKRKKKNDRKLKQHTFNDVNDRYCAAQNFALPVGNLDCLVDQ